MEFAPEMAGSREVMDFSWAAWESGILASVYIPATNTGSP